MNVLKKFFQKGKIDVNLLIAVGVLISSFAALFVYVRQANIMNEQTKILLEQTKANAWPHISIEKTTGFSLKDGAKQFQISVVNKGTGPAIIEQVKLSYNNTYVKNWEDFHKTTNFPDSVNYHYSNQSISNRVLSSNEELILVDWSGINRDNPNERFIDFIKRNAEKISLEICYKSVFGDYWTVGRKGFKTDIEDIYRNASNNCPHEGIEFME